jgi:hypothetical protein
VTCQPRDENAPLAREMQTWWIEPIPEREYGEKEDPIYTITNIALGQSIDAPQEKNGGKIVTYQSHAQPWQLWKIVRLTENKDGCVNKFCAEISLLGAKPFGSEFYQIVSIYSGLALDSVNGSTAETSTAIHVWEACPTNTNQIWELVIPTCSIPIGWHQLKNAATGHILQHTYPSSTPTLVPQMPHKVTSNYRETWGTQWAVIHGQACRKKPSRLSYQIRNRLTGGYLRCLQQSDTAASRYAEADVHAWQTTPYNSPKLWKFDLDLRRNWKIVDETSGNLLAEAPDAGKLVCCSKQLDRRRTWSFV